MHKLQLQLAGEKKNSSKMYKLKLHGLVSPAGATKPQQLTPENRQHSSSFPPTITTPPVLFFSCSNLLENPPRFSATDWRIWPSPPSHHPPDSFVPFASLLKCWVDLSQSFPNTAFLCLLMHQFKSPKAGLHKKEFPIFQKQYFWHACNFISQWFGIEALFFLRFFFATFFFIIL